MSSQGIRGQFTAPGRSMAVEDRVSLVSVGVDIGSSTTHLMFSKLELERVDSRYVTTNREVLYESEILLTPYLADVTIDERALGDFVHAQYAAAGIERSDVDTGALILTGVALDRRNARAVADLFAEEAGRFVAVSAGDNLEAVMAANGSGAIALSETTGAVLNVDIGGGTTKVVVCRDGYPEEIMAIDVGARLVAYDEQGRITRIEPTAVRFAEQAGIDLELGQIVTPDQLAALSAQMVDVLLAEISPKAAGDPASGSYLRTDPLRDLSGISAVTFSGGTSEYVYRRATRTFGDLGPYLADALLARLDDLPASTVEAAAGIRATVIGASQHTVQVSGSTICIAPMDIVPIRNVPVVKPRIPWGDDADAIDSDGVADSIRVALRRFDLADADSPVALALAWQGSATYARIKAFGQGVVTGLGDHIAAGHPVMLVFDGDIGGLVGLHLVEESQVASGVISVDGVDLAEFDYVDVGEMIPSSGAVPLVIKSLVFSSMRSDLRNS